MPLVAMMLYALLITPMVVELRADAGGTLRMQLRIRVWRMAFRLDAHVRRGTDGTYIVVREMRRRKPSKTSDEKNVRMRSVARLMLSHPDARRFLLSRVRIHSLRADVRLGVGDAAYTAWAGGALMAALFPFGRWMERRHGVRPHIDVRCDWQNAACIVQATGIIVLLPGDIMAALAIAAAQKLRKEARKRWTGIPLKA